jgi:D-alanyl-D-alanine carboxypeptidase
VRRPTALVIALLAVAVGMPAASAATAGAAQGREAKLRDVLAALVAESDAPGGVLLVRTTAGTWQRAVGLAEIRPRKTMTVSGRFRIASVTKTFTAALVLRLVGDGKLLLEDTLDRWLPNRLPNGAAAAISIRQLLSHRSGLSDDSPEWIAEPPGRYYYANRNYLLLGEVVEAVTATTFETALGERILRPLRLGKTEPSTAAAAAGIVHGYSPSRPRVDFTALPLTGPHGGLVSTAADVASFARALFRGTLLPKPLLAEMTTAGSVQGFATAGYTAYGLGLMRFPSRCGPAWGHRGRHYGYTTFLLSTAGGARTAVVLLNSGQIGNTAVVARLSRLATSALCT